MTERDFPSDSVQKSSRLSALDNLRGLLLVLMAIDHANYFITRMHPTGEFWGIALPQYESIGAFLTRFLTQPCAPGFFLLVGISMVLLYNSRLAKGWSEARIRKFLLTRGLILVFMQFFLENFSWMFGPVSSLEPPGGVDQVWMHFGVLFGLGMVMIFWSLLMHLASVWVLGISLAAVFATQILIPGPSQADVLFFPLLRIILIPGKSGFIQVFYPILPWLGVTGIGIILGKWLKSEVNKAYSKIFMLGAGAILLFFIFRITGDFGSIHPVKSAGITAFLNVTKYPPSLVFLLLTLGICMLVLALFSKLESKLSGSRNPLLVFGRVPFFFYIFHLYFFALTGLIWAAKNGTSLLIMYLVWLVGLIFLYPLCRWYEKFKNRKPVESVWRFF